MNEQPSNVILPILAQAEVFLLPNQNCLATATARPMSVTRYSTSLSFVLIAVSQPRSTKRSYLLRSTLPVVYLRPSLAAIWRINLRSSSCMMHLISRDLTVSQRSFPLCLLPRFSCDQARSVFAIGRESLSLSLAGKMSHRKAVSFDGPPSLGRSMRPGLDRHHLIGFVRVVVGHLPSPPGSRSEYFATLPCG